MTCHILLLTAQHEKAPSRLPVPPALEYRTEILLSSMTLDRIVGFVKGCAAGKLACDLQASGQSGRVWTAGPL